MILLVSVLLLTSAVALSQSKNEDEKQGTARIKLELDNNGRKVMIDTSFEMADMESVEKFLKSIDPELKLFENDAWDNDHKMEFYFDSKDWNKDVFNDFDKEMSRMDDLLREMNVEISKKCIKICCDSMIGGKGDYNCTMMYLNGGDFEKDMISLDGKDERIIIRKMNVDEGNEKNEFDKTIILEQEGSGGTNSVEIKRGDKVIVIKEIRSRKSGDDIETGKTAGDIDAVNSDLAIGEFEFYPNPGNGRFTVSFELQAKDPVTLSLFDITGRKVFSETTKKFSGKYSRSIDISDKRKGTYLLQIEQNGKIFSKKFMIE